MTVASDDHERVLTLLGPHRAQELYLQMVLIRRFDEVALQARLDGRVFGTMHPYTGQEAIAVGVCGALRPTDRIVSNHRGHGHCIAKGGDPARMMAELFGRSTGYCRGKGGSMHIADFGIGMLGANGVVGAGLPIAVGSALASLLDGSETVTVAFFGEGATGQGVFHESLNVSAIWDLPVIWVCENNLYSVDSRVDQVLPTTDVSRLADGYGLPAAVVDGNDVLAVLGATLEAAERARAGQGPTFIEARTYRWGVHSARIPDNRPPEELLAWKARDPITVFADVLSRVVGFPAHTQRSIGERADALLKEAVAFAESSPYPQPDEALLDMWAD